MKSIIKPLIAIAGVLLLSACQTDTKPVLISRTYTVVIPPDSLSNQCKIVKLPDPESLTNGELASLIVDLEKMNRKCVYSIAAIKDYLAKAKAKIEEQK